MNDAFTIPTLNAKIDIINLVKTTTSTGEKTEVEGETFLSCWAKLENQSGTEETEGKIRMLDVRSYIVRFKPTLLGKSVTSKYIKDEYGEKFNIHSSQQIYGTKRYLKLKCSKRE